MRLKRNRKIWPIKYILVLLAGVIFSSYLFYSINETYKVRNVSAVETAVAKVQVKLIKELEKINVVMESMEIFIKNTDTVPLSTFSELTTPFINDLNGILLLGWRPNTEYLQMDTIENNQVHDSISIPKFTMLAGLPVTKGTETQGKLETGVDLIDMGKLGYSEEVIRSAIEKTLESSKTSFSKPLVPLKDKDAPMGFLSLISVYDSTGSSVKGVSFGVFDMDRFIKETLRYELPILDMTIRDKLHPEEPLFVEHTNNSRQDVKVTKLELNAANRVWEVVLSPKKAYVDYPNSYESYFVLLLGICSSFLAALVLKQRDEYLTRLSQEVLSRTRELEESNKLKETLLREIHHRVKNNLQIASSLMNLQKRRLKDKEMIDAFTNSQGRILAIALIHEKIYEHQDAKAVDLQSYLKDLMTFHQRISPSVKYDIDCPEISIDLDTAVPVALIISELVVNALKHAFVDDSREKHLAIRVKVHSDGEIELAICDNGMGLPNHFDINKEKGLGFEIVKKLCRQINAKFSFDSSETMTTFKILFRQRS